MAAMESAPPARNIKHAALVAVNDKIITSISADPQDVAQTLFAKGMIPQGVLAQADNKTQKERASELMRVVLTKVEVFPDTFDVFVDVIQERPWLKESVKLIQNQLEVSVKKLIHLIILLVNYEPLACWLLSL
jgi:hypothetical protein